MTDVEKNSFIQLSLLLTGFTELAPQFDPDNIIGQLYDCMVAQTSAKRVTALLAWYDTAVAQHVPPQQIGTALMAGEFADMGRNIVRLWLLGLWDTADTASAPPPVGTYTPVVVSSDGYIYGGVWQLAQAHPMGFSTLSYGYWNTPSQLALPIPTTAAAQPV